MYLLDYQWLILQLQNIYLSDVKNITWMFNKVNTHVFSDPQKGCVDV